MTTGIPVASLLATAEVRSIPRRYFRASVVPDLNPPPIPSASVRQTNTRKLEQMPLLSEMPLSYDEISAPDVLVKIAFAPPVFPAVRGIVSPVAPTGSALGVSRQFAPFYQEVVQRSALVSILWHSQDGRSPPSNAARRVV